MHIPGSHEYFMQKALMEAQNAFDEDEVPVGAIVVMNNKIIARAYNQTEKLTDATAHAEMLAITSATNSIGAKFLPEATLYVTLEPCPMCAGAIYWSRVGTVVYGASDAKSGYSHFYKETQLHPKTVIIRGVLEAECSKLMVDFFKQKR